ncbi:MAG: hypothetical protein AAGA64_02220 [Bacteroidota bacterium]
MNANANKHIDKANERKTLRAEQIYAIAGENEIVKRFQFKLKSGEIYSLPYSLLPAYILTSEGQLVVRAYGLIATITGRNMMALEEYFNAERILWIRESATGLDTGESHIFIDNIDIEGRTISLHLREGEE